MLFVTWVADPFRPPRDLDLLGHGDSDAEAIAETFRAIRAQLVADDGVTFDVAALAALEVSTANSQIIEAEADQLRDRTAHTEIVPIAELADGTVSSVAIHLRSLLTPNSACPVCGSTDHPHLVHPSALNEIAAPRR